MGIFKGSKTDIAASNTGNLAVRKRRRGSATLEVIFAIFIIASAALMFAALVPPAAKSERMLSSHQQATSLIQHKIDQLRGVGWGRLTFQELRDAEIIDATPTASPFSWATTDNLTTYYKAATGTITVTDFSTNVKQVVVTLTWTGVARKQGNGSLSITTLIAK